MRRARFLMIGLVLASVLSLGRTVLAQSPPLGPPVFRKDDHQLPVGVLTGAVKAKVQEIVDNANVMIKQQTSLAKAELKNVKVYPPFRTATEYKDRPNQFYIDIPMNIQITIDITAASDRQIYYPLDLKIFCDGWQTGNGSINVIAQTGPPSVEGGNIFEDIIHVRDYIDSKIRQNIATPGSIKIPLAIPCVTLGAVPVSGNDVLFSYIAYDPPPKKRIIISGAFQPTLEIKLLQLKRLTAHDIRGGVLYYPTENITLSTYADFSYNQVNLTMKEGDVVPLNVAPITLKPPLYDKFVLIANITQQPSGQLVDSSFDVTLATANYSPGTRTIQISKTYSQPPDQFHPKPVFVQVPAYELTYSIKYISPPRVVSSPAVGTSP